MLQVHLIDGRTLRFDLKDQRQADDWISKACEPEFQAAISGMTLLQNGVQYSFPRPHGFRKVWLFAEDLQPNEIRKFKGGERITGQADNVRVAVMVHNGQRAVRIGLSNPGFQCYNPIMDSRGKDLRGDSEN